MRKQWAAGIIVFVVLVLTGSVQAAPQPPCVGDCNDDGMVAINELVVGVNMALGLAAGSACAAFLPNPGQTTPGIGDLVTAVNHALNGCPPAPTTAGLVFNGEANRLIAYRPGDGFPSQVVIPSDADAPGEGRDINGQICFTRGPRGEYWFIAGEDTGQGASHSTAGWGLFELRGAFPEFTWEQINKFRPTYQEGEAAENYGCGFLSDGRLVTTDIGNQAAGPGTGQLIVWFPPLDGFGARYCKLDIAITTAQQIAIDDQDRIYVSSARGDETNPAGVYRYSGNLPSAADAAGGCGRVDPTGAPLVSEGRVVKELFIPADEHLVTPAGVVRRPQGGFYVASVLNGVIAEYDADGRFVRRVLDPPTDDIPPPTGTPLGIGLASDGTLYYADIGLRLEPPIGPGPDSGTVRRIRFVDGVPQPPELIADGLNFPDGIGVFEP